MLGDQLLTPRPWIPTSESVPDEDAIREQLARMLRSRLFAGSERMKRFLLFAVTETLGGRVGSLKEYTIGSAVFDRPATFDPGIDPIVRVEARRLREKLQSYYLDAGRNDKVIIDLPKGHYSATFNWRREPSQAHAPTTPMLAVDTIAPLRGGAEKISEALKFELIDQLARVHGIGVTASITQSSGRSLSGCVHVREARIRVIAHLWDVVTRECLWSMAVEHPADDVAHEELAAQIAACVARSAV